MQEYGTLTMMRGGDKNFRLYFPGVGDQPLSLVDHTVAPFEEHPALTANLTLRIDEPLTGAVEGLIKWNAAYALGSTMTFYVQLRLADALISAPKLVVKII